MRYSEGSNSSVFGSRIAKNMGQLAKRHIDAAHSMFLEKKTIYPMLDEDSVKVIYKELFDAIATEEYSRLDSMASPAEIDKIIERVEDRVRKMQEMFPDVYVDLDRMRHEAKSDKRMFNRRPGEHGKYTMRLFKHFRKPE